MISCLFNMFKSTAVKRTISTLRESVCGDKILAWASNFLESLPIAWQPLWPEAICKHEQRAERLRFEVLDWGLGLEGGSGGAGAAVAAAELAEDCG